MTSLTRVSVGSGALVESGGGGGIPGAGLGRKLGRVGRGEGSRGGEGALGSGESGVGEARWTTLGACGLSAAANGFSVTTGFVVGLGDPNRAMLAWALGTATAGAGALALGGGGGGGGRFKHSAAT